MSADSLNIIADSAENRTNLLPTIENGMSYDLWVAQALHVLFMAAKLFLRQATGHLIGTNKSKVTNDSKSQIQTSTYSINIGQSDGRSYGYRRYILLAL